MPKYELTVLDVATRLRVCEDTVYMLLRRGELEGYKVGLQWRISKPKLEEFIAAAGNNRKRPEDLMK